jgi:Met-10+ like-protein
LLDKLINHGSSPECDSLPGERGIRRYAQWFVSLLRLIPDQGPGKTRLGRILLHPFRFQTQAVLKDRTKCTYILPSYAEPIAQHLFTFGAYERDTQNAILKFLPERGVFIDVGANIGAPSIPIARARPHASIICIEADPRIHSILNENITRNG